jgi:2-keto-4-pentenoate hydratase/2-oxohepta-3-ene-1,7-dioic acid hydratase in catechol pathway
MFGADSGADLRDRSVGFESRSVDHRSLANRTARNLQDQVKAKGLPWSAVKGFDTFCPISNFLPRGAIKDPHDCQLTLKVTLQEPCYQQLTDGADQRRGQTARLNCKVLYRQP